MTCCEFHGHNCRQGRDCPERIAMQLHRIDPLEMAKKCGFVHTKDGGHEVSNEVSVRIDAPDATEQSDSIALPVLVAAIAAAMLVAAGVFEFPIPFVSH